MRRCFPIESVPVQEARAAGGGRGCGRCSGRCTFVPMTSHAYLSSAGVTPATSVTQSPCARAAQLSNFDNALLCSAFKFYPTFAGWRFLTFLSRSPAAEKCSGRTAWSPAMHFHCCSSRGALFQLTGGRIRAAVEGTFYGCVYCAFTEVLKEITDIVSLGRRELVS